jgi:hypothetical protein
MTAIAVVISFNRCYFQQYPNKLPPAPSLNISGKIIFYIKFFLTFYTYAFLAYPLVLSERHEGGSIAGDRS